MAAATRKMINLKDEILAEKMKNLIHLKAILLTSSKTN